ncbi:TlpA family protein disulfide reductase [Chitinophaga nivalis]|uniref:Redoxin domain-containing protein n=1 Tax=Chitinophaga nivalis TaxID=2991709 RepID=A0ABT3IQI6_9BACT|nr:redoxin domain-containing protein [Chitinophaga nivalis]MCW3464107.1 redoxin domain-containing protein [Chitinophaga nivalis]MCW3486203.1 redoxin domain-containing protein [Chitinophaga nivalis]
MKYYFLLVITFLGVLNIHVCKGQYNSSKSGKYFQVGDTLPDIYLNNIINYKTTSTKLSDLKYELLILDFWATWCAPCVYFMFKADELKKRFKDRIEILPVTAEKETVVGPFLKRIQQEKKVVLSSVVKDSILRNMFWFNSLPHEVWIDRNRVVKAITGYTDVTYENVSRILDNKKLNLPVKVDIKYKDYDRDKPIYMGVQTGFNPKEGLEYYSVFKKYDSSLLSMNVTRDEFLTCTNSTALGLFQVAFGDNRPPFLVMNRIVLDIKDSSSVVDECFSNRNKNINEWYKDNLYNYELTILDTLIRKNRYDVMRKDVNNYFGIKLGIEGHLERKKMLCWVLERTSNIDKIQTKGGRSLDNRNAFTFELKNRSLQYFMTYLQISYLQESPIPIIDNTNYSGNIDIVLNCDLSNINSINEELGKYDLKFVKKESLVEVIVISELNKNKSLVIN